MLLNNAGILRDISFKNMKDSDWDLINRVHTYGAYKVSYSRGNPVTSARTDYPPI